MKQKSQTTTFNLHIPATEKGFIQPPFSDDTQGSAEKDKLRAKKFKHQDATKSGAGFTLLELLVVLAIIGLLAGIIMIALNSARVKGRDAKRVGDMRQMISSMEQYNTHNGIYPTGTASIGAAGVLLSDPGALDGGSEIFIPNYVASLPTAPEPADGSCGNSSGRDNNNYWYDAAPDGTTYTLTFCLGNDNADWRAGVRSITPSGVQ